MSDTLALYIHWPFCLSKCPYCDFNSHVRDNAPADGVAAALLRELGHYAALLPGRTLASIFFGGGTPSLMDPAHVAALVDAATQYWRAADDIEITLEANPTSVEAGKFRDLRTAGVGRVSLGVQALDDAALMALGRGHSAAEARAAVALAAKIFPRFSFDLIYARAGQTQAAWRAELADALVMARGHLSLYQLTIEPGTQFATRAGRGEKLAAETEEAGTMYELTQEIMEAAGLPAYEISNHARAGDASRHNLAYWHYNDYIGIGAGAHGRYAGADGARFATENHRMPEVWLGQVERDGHGQRLCDGIGSATAQREALMMGLRLRTGIARAHWRAKFGGDIADTLPARKITKLAEEGLIALDDTALRATPAGLQRLNGVLGYLLADETA
ncbi:MAG: coproporphyrinogen III oxidase [Alphaproteobacteria bacterium]|nr:coproporphyrinogen III oxidase [Alphaproteobacteria bacterium]